MLHFSSSSLPDSIHPSHWGPEGGRSGTVDDAPAENNLQHTQQLQHHRTFPLCSSNDDRCFTCPQHQTHVAFSNTNDMVSSLCRAHLLTLTLVLVFFPLHIYMESVVCLCSVGGFCPFVWKRHQTGPEGHMMAWTWLRRLFFVLWHCHWPQLSFFLSSFDGKLHHKAEKRKVTQMSSLFFFFSGQMLPNVFTVCWLLQVMLKVFLMMNTSFLAHPMCVLNPWWFIFTYLVKKLMEFALL